MKKRFIIVLLLFITLFVTGCGVNSEEATGIHKALVKAGILEDNMKFVEEYTLHGSSSGLPYKTKYYIFKKKDGSQISIKYKKNEYTDVYTAYIFDVESRSTCTKEDDKSLDCCISCYDTKTKVHYEFSSDVKMYNLKEKNSLFFKSFELVD